MKVGRVEEMAGHLHRLRAKVTSEFLPDRGDVLEIGPGDVAYDRKGCRTVAVNISVRGDPQVLADGQSLPFRDASFDAILATEVIEHVRYPYRLLREIRRLLKPGGRALLSTPNVATPVNRVALAFMGLFPDDRTLHEGADVGHIHFFTRRSFFEAVTAEQFTVIREWNYLLQLMPHRYIYDTFLERALRNLSKMIMLELRPKTQV